MSTAPTNQNHSESTAEKLSGSVYKPEDLEGTYSEVPITDFVTKLGANITFASYTLDGSSGWAIYGPNSAVHFTSMGDMVFTAAPPGESGCGGKSVMKSEAKLEKAKSITIEVTGRPDDGLKNTSVNKDGNVQEEKLPAYSLKVYGDVLIECIGGEAIIKGDNITLNANSTLNLNSKKDINIQAAKDSGRVSINCGTFELNAAKFNKKISGGEYTDGAGEVQTDQYNPGAVTSINSPGSIKYSVNGDYEVGVTGNFKQIVNRNYSLAVDGDYAHDVKGNYSESILGKQKSKIDGKALKPPSSQVENYLIQIGVNEKKGMPGFKIDSGADVEVQTTVGGIALKTLKEVSSLKLTEKDFTVKVGKELGSIELNEKQSLLSYGKVSKVEIGPDKISIIQPTGIYLN